MEKKKKSNSQNLEEKKSTNNRLALIVCIFLSILLWLSIQLNKEGVYNCTIPLEYIVPNNYILTTPLPEEITVGIKGDLNKLLLTQSRLKKSPLEISVVQEKALTPDIIEAQLLKLLDPNIYKIVQIDIAPTSISIDTSQNKIVRITANNDLELRDGYCISSTKFSPSTVSITGPARIIRTIEEINSSKLVLKDLHKNYQDSIALLPSYSKLITLGQDKSLMEIKVEALVEKEIPVPLNQLTKDINYAYDTLLLKVSLPSSDYEAFEPSWINLKISEKDSLGTTLRLTSNRENLEILDYN